MGTTDNETSYGTSEDSLDYKALYEETQNNYKNLQADYTRKSQKLKDFEGQGSASGLDPDEVTNWMKEVATEVANERLSEIKQSQEWEKSTKDFFSYMPELETQKDAIVKLAQADGIAIEDVVEKYGFATKNKLEKAKERSLLGDRGETKQKSISDLSSEEFEARLKTNATGSKFA